MPNPTTAAEWLQQVIEICQHPNADYYGPCQSCWITGFEGYARQRVEEALEKAEGIAAKIGARKKDPYYDNPNVPWQTVAINIAAAIAVLKCTLLREGWDA